MIDSLGHVQVVGALARLAGNGAWARLTAATPLEDDRDLADARLLVAAGILRERGPDLFEPIDLHPWYDDPGVLATGLLAQLRRALSHGADQDHDIGVDLHEIAAMGVASQSVAAILADSVLPMLSTTAARLEDGTARFLDVGVGTGAIADTLCRSFPGIRAVGLDVSTEALDAARRRLAGSPVADRVELREQSVVDLAEEEVYDLAWIPQLFLPRADLVAGLATVHRALRPGCWLVMPVAAGGAGSSDLARAALEHDAAIRGGGSISVAHATELLEAAGFVEIRDLPGVSQSLLMARKG